MSRLIIGIAILALAVSTQVEAATINAASCSRADVGAAVAAASDGDTVQVPAGTCTWTSTLTVTKGITLGGAGIDQTIIRDDVPRTGSGRVIEFDTGLGVNWRLTGFTFRSGIVTDWNWDGLILVSGRSHAFRIDHVKVDNPNATAIRLYSDARGVIDHCEFYTTKNGQFMVVNHTSWNGVGSFGDNSWASPTALGTADAVYFEDNTFTVVGNLQTVIDSTGGGRYVARHNTFDNAAVGGHGADSSQRNRSLRSYEFYNNTFIYPGTGGFAAIYVRGGTGVVFNNTFSGYQNAFLGATYRYFQSFTPWGQCNGTSPYDGNSGSPAGYPCIDQVGRGAGNLLLGELPLPVAWPNQALEPVYTWANVLNGANIGSQHAPVQVGRDLLLDTPKPGYQPFTYPHPLVTGAPPPPPPPPPADTLDLAVSKSGTGSGTVTSSPAGINCGPDCFESYPRGTVVTLTATPDPGSTFTGWGGACSGTSICSVTGNTPVSVSAAFAASGGSSITIGETSILSADDNANGNLLLAQAATLSQAATIQSLSFYVTVASGTLQLGIYDATGPGGGPGAKKAETAAFTSVVGWNTAAVTAPVSLPPATYWLAYLPSSSALAFKKELTGSARYYPFTYGPMPATFSTSPTSEAVHWSLYATLTVDGSPPPPPPPPSPPTAPSGITTRRSAITVAWVDNSANETGFEVWRQVGSAAYALLATGAANATTHTDSNVATGLQHCYKVRAVNAAGVSAFTAQSCNTP